MVRVTLHRSALWCLLIACGVAMHRSADAQDTSAPIRLPAGEPLVEADFDRHVTSLLGRLGCNSAACHGATRGQGGLRLSLFGQDPASDFAELTSHERPRVRRDAPDASLVLIKARGDDDHGGGKRCASDSWEYQVLRRWIAAGAMRRNERGVTTKLTVETRGDESKSLAPAATFRLRAIARFADGSQEDVTSFAEFRSRDEELATVGPAGEVTIRGSGLATVMVTYRTEVAATQLAVPFRRAERVEAANLVSESPSLVESAKGRARNLIDEELAGLIDQLQLDVSPRAEDGEFLRRVTLDTIGITPTVAETRAFLASTAPDKRVQKIEELLRHPRRAAWWASHLCDQTVCNVEHLGAPVELRARRAKMWHDWFRKRIANNTPYDQIARGVLCATSVGSEGRDAWIDREAALEAAAQAGFESNYAERTDLDLFWRRLGPTGPLPVEDVAELTASAFLGLQLRCARCHQHPYDQWTQNDFASFANIFARIEYGSSTDLRQAMSNRLERRREARSAGRGEPELPRLQEVFLAERPRPLVDAASAGERRLRAPGGPELEAAGDPRTALFVWLTRADNPYFAPNLVNRVWARYFGTGLVEPLDGFSRSNPATHPRLLQRLSDEFVRSGYDLRALERTILSSAVYQRSARPRGNNAADQRCLSHAPVRPIPAAALVDSIHQALDVSANFGPDAPTGCQAIELAVNQFERPETQSMFRALGRRERRTLCDCESNVAQSLRSELFLLSDSELATKLAQGRVARLAAGETSTEDAIDELYLATVSRPPSADEREFALKHVANGANRQSGFADLMWALLNSREFLTNH